MENAKGRIIVTPKGLELQTQILKDTLLQTSTINSAKSTFYSPRPVKTAQATSSISILPSYFFPKPGYFGLRASNPDIKVQQFLHSNEPQIYPNYLKRDPKEYPPRHICISTPKSIIGPKKVAEEVPTGKYVHHTLFTEPSIRGTEYSPRIDSLNHLAYGKAYPFPINLSSAEFRSWNETGVKDSQDSDLDMRKSFQSTYYNAKNRFGSTGFSKFRNSVVDIEAREDRIVNKHMEYEKEFQKVLVRLDEEAKKKMSRYQENQHEAPEFQKKLKTGQSALEEIDARKNNENIRFMERLKTYQRRKYGHTFKAFEEFNKNIIILPRKPKASKKGVEITGQQAEQEPEKKVVFVKQGSSVSNSYGRQSTKNLKELEESLKSNKARSLSKDVTSLVQLSPIKRGKDSNDPKLKRVSSIALKQACEIYGQN